MDQVRHTDLGAYVLGILDPEDGRAFDAHLTTCGSCPAELASLSTVASLVQRHKQELSDVATAPIQQPVASLPRLRAESNKRPRRSRDLALAAAAVVIAAGGGLGIGASLEQPGATTGTPVASDQFEAATERSGRDPETGALGTVAMRPKAWGTDIALELVNVPGPAQCSLIAVTEGGDEQVAASWRIPDGGHDRTTLRGGVPSTPDDIAKFVIRTTDHKLLLTIPT